MHAYFQRTPTIDVLPSFVHLLKCDAQKICGPEILEGAVIYSIAGGLRHWPHEKSFPDLALGMEFK